MKLYWQERRMGQRLILALDDESEANEVEVGAVRKTPRGFDALAKTNTYDPGRAQKGFATIEEAKFFVESFHPWDLFGGDLDLEVEPEVRPLPTGDTGQASDESPQAGATATAQQVEEEPDPAQPVATSDAPRKAGMAGEPGQSAGEDGKPGKRGWQFWKKD